MAIARGAGTEIIRCHHFEDVDNTGIPLIVGVQHHIYTILSIVCYAESLNASGDYIRARLSAYDSFGSDGSSRIYIFTQDMNALETFVWNDKFSFNGTEPTDFTGTMDSEADQNLISDQATTTSQSLYIESEHASDNFDISITFIDQNNA